MDEHGMDEFLDQRNQAIAFIKGCLFDATQENYALEQFDPTNPTIEWLDGVGAGRRVGIIQALAISLAAITGESPTQLVEDAYAQALVESEFPFELSWEEA